MYWIIGVHVFHGIYFFIYKITIQKKKRDDRPTTKRNRNSMHLLINGPLVQYRVRHSTGCFAIA